MDVPHPRRVAVSRPVRSCHADSRLREHRVPGERSYPPRSVGEWDGGDTDGRGAVLQRLHMVVCGWPILACVVETPATTAMAPRRGAVSHTRDLPPRPA